MSFNDYNRQKIDLLLQYLEVLQSDANAAERRCTNAGQMAGSALHSGEYTGLEMAKRAVLRILLNQKEVEQ